MHHRIWFWLIHSNWFYDRIFFYFYCKSWFYFFLKFMAKSTFLHKSRKKSTSIIFSLKLSICLTIMEEFFFWLALRDYRGSSPTNEFFSTAVNMKIFRDFLINLSQWTAVDKKCKVRTSLWNLFQSEENQEKYQFVQV